VGNEGAKFHGPLTGNIAEFVYVNRRKHKL